MDQPPVICLNRRSNTRRFRLHARTCMKQSTTLFGKRLLDQFPSTKGRSEFRNQSNASFLLIVALHDVIATADRETEFTSPTSAICQD